MNEFLVNCIEAVDNDKMVNGFILGKSDGTKAGIIITAKWSVIRKTNEW